MNKTEYVRLVAEKAGLTHKQAEAAYQAQLEVIQEALKQGDKVALVGFGTYELKSKPAREVFNPLTKQKVKIEATNVPTFNMGKAFKDLF